MDLTNVKHHASAIITSYKTILCPQNELKTLVSCLVGLFTFEFILLGVLKTP